MTTPQSSTAYNEDPRHIQDIVFYFSSRLRAASIATVNSTQVKKEWMQKYLALDLKLALSFIGLAAAIGHSCNIPFIIRTLSLNLYISADGESVSIDRDLLCLLDAGADSDDRSSIVDSYYLQWWTSTIPPADNAILTWMNIELALNHHTQLSFQEPILPIEVNKKKYTWPRHMDLNPLNVPLKCDRCHLYRGVSFGVLYNLLDLRHQVHGLEVASHFRTEQSERRAAGFFQLYNSVLLKELGSSSSITKRGKGKATNRTSEDIRLEAAAELARLENLPSLKWTWGPSLSKEEVLSLAKPISHRPPHSGYLISLPWGRFLKDSCGPDSPPHSQVVSELADDYNDVPELHPDDIPSHFLCYPLRNEINASPQMMVPNESAADSNPHPPSSSWLSPPPADFFPVPPVHEDVSDAAEAHQPAEAIPLSDLDVFDAGPADAYPTSDSDDVEAAPCDAFLTSDSEDAEAAPCDAFLSSDSDVDVDAAPGDAVSSDDSEDFDAGPEDAFQLSDSHDDIDAAPGDAVSSYDSDDFDAGPADAFHSEASPFPSIPGPFTPQYFANIPSHWLQMASDDDTTVSSHSSLSNDEQ